MKCDIFQLKRAGVGAGCVGVGVPVGAAVGVGICEREGVSRRRAAGGRVNAGVVWVRFGGRGCGTRASVHLGVGLGFGAWARVWA